MQPDLKDYRKSITDFMRDSFVALREDLTVEEALENIRDRNVDFDIVYFYTVDGRNRLTGVIPVKRLIVTDKTMPICAISVKDVVTVSSEMTLLEASELFFFHKFLSFPVVDGDHRILGVVDITLFTRKNVSTGDSAVLDEVFQTIGLRLNDLKNASAWKAFRKRFPWLTATIASGITSAVLASFYELTIVKSVMITFFLTLVLALGESVSMQTMTLMLQRILSNAPLRGRVAREILTVLLLGLASGAAVFAISLFWKANLPASLAIGLGITGSVFMSGVWGVTIPATLHRLKLDPKIAAGPLTLAVTDISTLLIFFNLAEILIR